MKCLKCGGKTDVRFTERYNDSVVRMRVCQNHKCRHAEPTKEIWRDQKVVSAG